MSKAPEDLMKNDSKVGFVEKVKTLVKEQAEIIHVKTGIPAKYVYIALGICIASVIIGYLEQYIVCVVGIVIPALLSMKALESQDTEDDKQWLTYWIVFGIFTFIDLFTNFLLKFIPFYFVLKILFLIWLFLPSFRGAKVIYKAFISGFYNKYRAQIDELDSRIESKANEYMGKANDLESTRQNNITK